MTWKARHAAKQLMSKHGELLDNISIQKLIRQLLIYKAAGATESQAKQRLLSEYQLGELHETEEDTQIYIDRDTLPKHLQQDDWR